MTIQSRLAALALPIIAAAAMGATSATPAAAGCHLIDCVEEVIVKKSEIKSLSCENLWILRNSIYDDAGYCFQTARGQKWFNNDGCTYYDSGDVPLSSIQHKNVKLFKSVEAAKGC